VETKIGEECINGLLRSQDVIGETVSYQLDVNGSIKNIYLTVDDIYTNITDGKMDLVLDLNLQGYPLSFVSDLSYSSIDVDDYSLSFTQNGLYLGSIQASDAVEDLCFEYLIDATEGIDIISIDASTREIKLNFESYLASTTVGTVSAKQLFDLVKSVKGVEASLIGSSIEDEDAAITLASKAA